MIEKATEGRLVLDTKIDLFPWGKAIHGVIDGRVDMGFVRTPYISGTWPLWNFDALPFFFDPVYEYERALNDPRMIELLDKTYAEVGLVKLLESASPAQDAIFCNKAIKTVADFKGVKVRTSGLLQTLTVELLGASPLTMPVMELAEALQRGTVDGVATGRAFGIAIGCADVSDYDNVWPVGSVFGGMVIANLDSFNALPADLQNILRDVSRTLQGQIFYAIEVKMRRALDTTRASRLELIVPEKAEIDKARELVKPAIDKWTEIAGPRAKEILAIAADYASGAEIMLK